MNKIKSIFSSGQGMVILLLAAVIGILTILFRMKALEQDYKIHEIDMSKRKEEIKNKEMAATEAKLLSIKNVREIAKELNLAEPSQKQIIVIPDKK